MIAVGRSYKILIVSSNFDRSEKIKRLLANKPFILIDAKDEDEAVNALASANKIFYIIIDYDSSNYNSLALLKKIKKRNFKGGVLLLIENLNDSIRKKIKFFESLSVTSLDRERDGIAYILDNYIRSFRKTKINIEVSRFVKFEKKLYVIPNSLKYMKPISEHLTRDLVQVGIVDKNFLFNVKFGIQEMIINAIEHGNLEITYEQKSEMLRNGLDLNEIIKKYSALPKFKNRKVYIKYLLTKKRALYIIKDQGNGFNWRETPDCSKSENHLLEHGRGIMMTKNYFDEVRYNDKGNEVTLVLNKKLIE
ncbi:MAG TPA: ATP-binding protein [Spirochaetota bacterium]|jgi:CheY-like chemotaxis protein|nr:MAG: hypothetical protein BWX91_00512 [Spirochaetes bacterium ADurb.Bin133]HNZ26714.1 ATP-binding protein [Spirochaetota bacterium]HPY88033.1 ATP-binding protein [Spirochaetota bacterium]HQB60978.1 ATP-binding protein [Spirochaetota bacterium]